MILIVTYDLRSPKDYHLFYEALKQQGKWWHYMASTWLLSTSRNPQEVVDAVWPQMDAGDLLFVCQIARNYQGRLPQQAWEWINSELPGYAVPTSGAFNALAGLNPPAPTLADLLGSKRPSSIPPPPSMPDTSILPTSPYDPPKKK